MRNTTATRHTDQSAIRQEGVWPFGRYLAVFCLGIVLFLAFDLADGQNFNGDTDDLLRALEVRRFLATGSWYDLSFPAVRMPEVYVSPWSRLVDLPYALIALVISPAVGLERAIELSFLVWPPLMALAYGGLVVTVLRRLTPAADDLPISLLIAILLMSVYAIWEFSPGRIDHHNVQILLLLGLAYGVCRWDAVGGAIVGVAVPASVAVGLETLPVLAIALLALVATWTLGLHGSRIMLRATGTVCAIAAIMFALMLIRPAALLVGHNDSWSAPYALGLLAFGMLATAVPLSVRHEPPGLTGFAILGTGGLIALAAILSLYPDLLRGPYPMVSGLARTYWFDRILQERGALVFLSTGDFRSIILFFAAAATAALASIGPLGWTLRGHPALIVLCAIAWAAVLATLFSNRFLRIALSVVPLLLPTAIVNLRALYARSSARVMTIVVSAGLSASAAFYSAAMSSQSDDYDAFDQLVMNDCRHTDFSALRRIAPGRIITPPALGLQILYRDVPGISVSSISFHRAAPAMGSVLDLYMTADEGRRHSLLAGADYLAVCYSPVILTSGEKLPLLVDLMRGRQVPGIVAVARSGDLMLFKIDHTALK